MSEELWREEWVCFITFWRLPCDPFLWLSKVLPEGFIFLLVVPFSFEERRKPSGPSNSLTFVQTYTLKYLHLMLYQKQLTLHLLSNIYTSAHLQNRLLVFTENPVTRTFQSGIKPNNSNKMSSEPPKYYHNNSFHNETNLIHLQSWICAEEFWWKTEKNGIRTCLIQHWTYISHI